MEPEGYDTFENYCQERMNRGGHVGRVHQDWYGEDYR